MFRTQIVPAVVLFLSTLLLLPTAGVCGSTKAALGPNAGTIYASQVGAKCDGQHDDTIQIQNAIDMACSMGISRVELPFGRCTITSQINVRCDNIAIAGQGESATILAPTSSLSGSVLSIPGYGCTSIGALASDALAGTFTLLAVADPTSVAANDFVLVRDSADAANGKAQLNRVAAVQGNIITTADALSKDFSANEGGVLAKCGLQQNVTIRDLGVAGVQATAPESGGIGISGCAFCKLRNVHVSDMTGQGIAADLGYRNQLINVVVDRSGSPASAGLDLFWQTFPQVVEAEINSGGGNRFGVVLHYVHFATLADVHIDGGGAVGRGLKFTYSSNNTAVGVTVRDYQYSGIHFEHYSSDNTLLFCSVTATHGGIATFGNHNQRNHIVGCSAEQNFGTQFGQLSGDDDDTQIIGGTYGGVRRQPSRVLTVSSNNFRLLGANVYDDDILATQGMGFSVDQNSNHGLVVSGNRFAGFGAASGRSLNLSGTSVIGGMFLFNQLTDGISGTISGQMLFGNVGIQ
jgi:hypothetical protein